MAPGLRYASIADICYLTDRTFDVVSNRSRRLGLRPPFTFDGADALCIDLTGSGVLDLGRGIEAKNLHISRDSDNASGGLAYMCLPKIASGDGSCRLYQWLVGEGWYVTEGQPVAKILRLDLDCIEVVNASGSGRIKLLASPLDTLRTG